MSADRDDGLIEEQIDFYRTDATAFDDWLVTLVDTHVPHDGISVRDHFGRRWRVVHNLWHPRRLDVETR